MPFAFELDSNQVKEDDVPFADAVNFGKWIAIGLEIVAQEQVPLVQVNAEQLHEGEVQGRRSDEEKEGHAQLERHGGNVAKVRRVHHPEGNGEGTKKDHPEGGQKYFEEQGPVAGNPVHV